MLSKPTVANIGDPPEVLSPPLSLWPSATRGDYLDLVRMDQQHPAWEKLPVEHYWGPDPFVVLASEAPDRVRESLASVDPDCEVAFVHAVDQAWKR